jgi:hypothetical protein
MTDNLPQTVKIFVSWISAILIFGIIGYIIFHFGYKAGEFQGLAKSKEISTVSEKKIEEVKKYIPQEVPGIHFFKVNENKECPVGYEIKGRFTTDLGYFYTKDNKFYDRISPDICFVNEDVAMNKAGFIRK